MGDYVLVQVSNPNSAVNRKVEVMKAANLVSGGTLAGWTNAVATTPATTVIGTTTYNDADKFVYNWRQTGNWMVATDDYGNVIGLVPATVNYLVIEQIEWKHSGSTVGGGYALANVVLADGSKLSNVTISNINGFPASNAGDSYGAKASRHCFRQLCEQWR